MRSQVRSLPRTPHAGLVESEDTSDLSPDGETRAGSRPVSRTILRHSTSEVRPALNRERVVQLHLPQPHAGLAQLAERGPRNAEVIGSNPISSSIYPGVAQLEERVAWDHEAGRSSRPTRTRKDAQGSKKTVAL